MIPRYTLPEMEEIWSDKGKYDLWREVEVLYCEGMAKYGLIPKKAAHEIRSRAAYDIRRVHAIEKKTRHDVIAFLTDMAGRIGPSGRYLHLGMTSSDLLDTTLACQLRASGLVILSKLKKLRTVLRRQANRYKHTPMVGRTHGIHAEPITFGLKLLVWYAETDRNTARLERAVEEVSVGKITGAVGTMTHIDPRVERFVMRKLRLGTESVTTQIIQRDRHAAFCTTLAVIGASLEKMATEIRALQRTDIAEAEEPFTQGQKGSSAMPHKRNPILTERISGMARLLRTNSLAALENVALWHERDISHSSVERVIGPDSTILMDFMLHRLARIIQNLVVHSKRMEENMTLLKGLIFSQQVLMKLAAAGLKRQKAYDLVQRNALEVWDKKKDFKTRLLEDEEIKKHLPKEDIEEVFSVDYHLKHVEDIYQRVFT